MTSNELKGDLDGSGDEYFYSFVAARGELQIVVDATSSDGTANLEFELLDKDAANAILCCEFAQADSTGESGRTIKRVKISKPQTVVLHLIQGKTGRGSYRIRLSGTVGIKGGEADQ